MMNKKKSNTYKLAIVGEAGVGKSSIVERVVRARFSESTTSTIGAAYSSYKYGESTYQIWDTAGQERYQSLIPMYLRDSKVVLIVYDVTNEHSLNRIKNHWYQFAVDNVDNDCYLLLIGNKWDIIGGITESIEQEAAAFAKDNCLPHIKVSAKDGTNINCLFRNIESRMKEIRELEEAQRDEEAVPDGSGLVYIDWDEWTSRSESSMLSSCTGDRCVIQ